MKHDTGSLSVDPRYLDPLPVRDASNQHEKIAHTPRLHSHGERPSSSYTDSLRNHVGFSEMRSFPRRKQYLFTAISAHYRPVTLCSGGKDISDGMAVEDLSVGP